MSRYQLRLMGSFQFLREGEPALGFRSEKERALLAYLAVEADRPHSREALAALLWPEQPDDVAQNNLRVTLHRLRQVLGDPHTDLPLLEVSRGTIQLAQTGELWIDGLAFQDLLTRAEDHSHEKLATCPVCMTWYAEAEALYRGEFLLGVYPANSLPFSEWALLKREHLHSQAMGSLYLLTAYHQRRGELDQALGYARRQLELEPWREEAHCQMMTILALRGERSAALRQFERCRKVLWDELSVEPADETRLLYERILASRTRQRHNLPIQPTPFTGRKSELSRVIDQLADPSCRLLTILGPGGIGKSRMAARAAEMQIYTFLQGVYLVQLAGARSKEEAIRAIAGALDLQFHSAADHKAQLLDCLREKDMLLVLDNYEHLLGHPTSSAVELLDDLLENAPNLRILVTSRQRLNLSWERGFILQGFSFPEGVPDQEPETYEAVQFFLQSARRTDPRFHLTEGEAPSVVRICQLLEGVPLAIELAAAWTRVVSPDQIVAEIEGNLDFLTGPYPDLPERQRSLRATYEHSYQLLTPVEQQVLCRLSIFPTSFDRSAAEKVAGATLPVLISLSDRSLLETIRLNDRGSGLRYRMHELIKQFSSEKLAQDLGEHERVKDWHRSFYMRFLNDRNTQVMGGTASYQAVQEVRGEIENVRLALDRAIAQANLDELGHSLNILMFFYEIQGLFVEAERVFGKIRQRMEEIVHARQDTSDNAMVYLGRAEMYHGWYCMHLARYDQAIKLTQKGLEICRQYGDMEGYGLALNSLGIIATDQGKFRQAESYLQDALEVLSENGYTWSESGALGNLGFLAIKEGNPSHGSDFFQQSLVLHTQNNDEWGMAGDLDGLGDAALQLGNLEQAEKYFRRVLEIRQKHGQRWRVALSLNRLGDVAYRRQQYAEARRNYQESLTIIRDYGERYHLASILARYGEACAALGENAHARTSLQESLELAMVIGADSITVRALLGWAEQLAKDGDREQSVEILAAICEHPALEHEDRARAEQLLAKLQEQLPPQVVQSALESGKRAILDDLVRDILRSGV